MKTIWLASWYPNKIFPFNGDFIKRHAAAVSLYEDVHVITVERDEKGTVTKDILKEEFCNGRLGETIVYYHFPKQSISFLDKWRNERKYRKVYREAIREVIAKNGKPHLVHVHVGMKAGRLALWLKRSKGIPYLVSEHWSGFLEESDKRFFQLPFYLRRTWKKIMQQATGVSAVSKHLLDGVNKHFPASPGIVIPNVVDTSIFYPAPNTNGIRFIHISGLQSLKNPADIMKAFAIVLQLQPAAQMQVYGSMNPEIMQLSKQLGIDKHISFHNEVPQPVLATAMNQSTGLVLYSAFETFGCVVVEANACGVPAIVSDIPTFHETVTEGENGYFAPLHSSEALAKRMLELIKNRSSFDSHAIAAKTGSKYSYTVVGQQFSNWYRNMLKLS